jgi:hypothetical protein
LRERLKRTSRTGFSVSRKANVCSSPGLKARLLFSFASAASAGVCSARWNQVVFLRHGPGSIRRAGSGKGEVTNVAEGPAYAMRVVADFEMQTLTSEPAAASLPQLHVDFPSLTTKVQVKSQNYWQLGMKTGPKFQLLNYGRLCTLIGLYLELSLTLSSAIRSAVADLRQFD